MTAHVHHWMITDEGGELIGRCRRCRGRKVFPRIPKRNKGMEHWKEPILPKEQHLEAVMRLRDATAMIYDYTRGR